MKRIRNALFPRAVWLSLWIAGILSLGPISPASAQDASSLPRASISGTVVDKATGRPIPYARVTLQAPTPIEMVTDQDGTFRSAGLLFGTYETSWLGSDTKP